MDNQNSQVTEVPVSPPSQPLPPTPKSKLPFIMGGILLLMVVGGSSYYLGSKNSNSNQSSPSSVPTQPISPTGFLTPSINPSTPAAQLPLDWTYELSTACNVNLPLPPKKAPYYTPDDPSTNPDTVDTDGSFWQIEHTTNTQTTTMFPYWSRVIYSNPQAGGSGYVPGVVEVTCNTNTQNYTTSSLLAAYEKSFTNGTFSGISLNSREMVTMWGQQAAKITVKGGMYNSNNPEYLVATKEHIYHISSVSMSQSQTVKDTTNTILNNIVFKD